MSPIRFTLLLAGLSALAAGAAQAHPKLVGASPAPNSTVAAPRVIQLRFNERLVGQFSGADILKLGPGDHPVQKVGMTGAKLGADSRSFMIGLRAPLQPGLYRLAWHAVSTDTHRVQGSYSFRVR